MPQTTLSPTHFYGIACEGNTYADAHAGVNGVTNPWAGTDVVQAYRDEDGYHIGRLVARFNLTSLVGKIITSAILHVKFVRGSSIWWDENWDWYLQFRANPTFTIVPGINTVANFLAALGGTIFDTKYVEDCVVYDWYTFDVTAHVTAPTFTLSVISSRDKGEVPPAPSNTWEPADFKCGDFTPGETNRVKLVVDYISPGLSPEEFGWFFKQEGNYSQGTALVSVDSGANWAAQTWDFLFKTYCIPKEK